MDVETTSRREADEEKCYNRAENPMGHRERQQTVDEVALTASIVESVKESIPEMVERLFENARITTTERKEEAGNKIPRWCLWVWGAASRGTVGQTEQRRHIVEGGIRELDTLHMLLMEIWAGLVWEAKNDRDTEARLILDAKQLLPVDMSCEFGRKSKLLKRDEERPTRWPELMVYISETTTTIRAREDRAWGDSSYGMDKEPKRTEWKRNRTGSQERKQGGTYALCATGFTYLGSVRAL